MTTPFDDHDRIAKNEQAIGVVARDLAVLGEKVAAQTDTIRTFAPTAVQVAGLQADIDEVKRELRSIGDRITRHLSGVYDVVKEQNGRVRKLEIWRGTVDTFTGLFRWGVTVAVGVVCTVVSGLVVYILTH